MDIITLFKQETMWLARYSGPHATQIVDLFGHDTIPTSFTTARMALDVQQEVQKLNPECKVIVTIE